MMGGVFGGKLCIKSRAHSNSLVNFFDSWAAAATTGGTTEVTAARHAAALRHATTTSCLVDLHHDWVHHAFKLLLLGLELILLCQLVLVQPVKCLLDCLLDLVLVITLELVLELLLLQGVAHGKAVILQAILGLNFGLVGLILLTILLGLLDHAIDL